MTNKDYRAPDHWEMRVLAQPRDWITGNIVRIFERGFCLVQTKSGTIATHFGNLVVQENTYFRKKMPYQVAETYKIVDLFRRPVNIGLTVAFDREYVSPREKGLYCPWGISHDVLMKILPGVDPRVPSEDYHLRFLREFARNNLAMYREYIESFEVVRKLKEEHGVWGKAHQEKYEEIVREVGEPEERTLSKENRKMVVWRTFVGIYQLVYRGSIWDDPDEGICYPGWELESGDDVYRIHRGEVCRILAERYPEVAAQYRLNAERATEITLNCPYELKKRILERFVGEHGGKFAMRVYLWALEEPLFAEFEKIAK